MNIRMPTHLVANTKADTHTLFQLCYMKHKPLQVSSFTEYEPHSSCYYEQDTRLKKAGKGDKPLMMVSHVIVSKDYRQHTQLAAPDPDVNLQGGSCE